MSDVKKKHPAKTPNVSHIHTPGVEHEESDVNVGGVAWFTAALAALMLLTAVFMWGMFNFFARTETAKETKEPPPTELMVDKKLESGEPDTAFPEPRLQRRPLQDLQQFRQEQSKLLTTYGWVDTTGGIVRIPVEEAKKKLLKEGLPYRTATTPKPPEPPPGVKPTVRPKEQTDKQTRPRTVTENSENTGPGDAKEKIKQQ